MPNPNAEPAEMPKAQAAPMGRHAARGAFWMLMQTLGAKTTGVIAQFVIATWVTKEGFGKAYSAFTIVSFISVYPRFFMGEVLVQEQKRFARFSGTAFWVSLLTGIASMLAIWTAAPVAGIYKDDFDITWLMVVASLFFPIDSLAMLPVARMQIDLRFRGLSVIGVVANFATAVLQVCLALLHFGPYAIVAPKVIVSVAQTGAYWLACPVKVSRPRRKRWKPLLARGGMLSVSYYFWGVTFFGDNLSLYLFQSETIIGIYTFAFNLSTQTLQVLVSNLGSTLMAVLAKLQGEPERQGEALMRASRALALVAVYLCVLQAAVARPLLQFLYLHKWDDAVLVMQILSVAMVFGMTSVGSWALLRAQGRFRFEMHFQMAAAAVFMAGVLPAAKFGGATGVAVAVLIFYMGIYPSLLYFAVGRKRVGWKRVAGVYAAPLVCALVACAIPWGLLYVAEHIAHVAMPDRVRSLIQGLAVGLLSLPIYAGLMRLMWPEDFATVMGQVRGVIARVVRRPALTTPESVQR